MDCLVTFTPKGVVRGVPWVVLIATEASSEVGVPSDLQGDIILNTFYNHFKLCQGRIMMSQVKIL